MKKNSLSPNSVRKSITKKGKEFRILGIIPEHVSENESKKEGGKIIQNPEIISKPKHGFTCKPPLRSLYLEKPSGF